VEVTSDEYTSIRLGAKGEHRAYGFPCRDTTPSPCLSHPTSILVTSTALSNLVNPRTLSQPHQLRTLRQLRALHELRTLRALHGLRGLRLALGTVFPRGHTTHSH
jgi:hypothetical protein